MTVRRDAFVRIFGMKRFALALAALSILCLTGTAHAAGPLDKFVFIDARQPSAEAPLVVKITSKSGANSKTTSKASANSQIKSPINPVATQSTTTSAETAPEKTKTTKKVRL